MKRTIRLWDIVLINVVAVLGLRWIPIAAGYGASSILLWILAAILFFIPLGLVSSELATAWPDQGGIYVWVRKAYGEKISFIVAWFYWINSFFYLPALLTFFAVTLGFIINPALISNKLFITSLVLIELWAVAFLNFRDVKILKKIADLGATAGSIVPGVAIILLGALAIFVLKKPIPTDYSWSNWIPHLGSQSHLAFLSTLMFSMAGIEITAVLAGETKDPRRTFPRATLISALIIVLIYIMGTVAMTFMVAPQEIGAASGIMDALKMISGEFNWSFLVPLVGGLILLGGIGGASVWLVVPIKLFLESAQKDVLPKFVTKLNKNEMPSNAIFSQTVVVTFIVLLTSLMSTVNTFYEILVLMSTITYFVPYLFMFASFIKLRKSAPEVVRPYRVPGGEVWGKVIATAGFLSVLFAVVLPFIVTPEDIKGFTHILLYRIELGGGVFFFALLGYVLYLRHKKRNRMS
jgi:glutamate:GABA antiporter